MFLFRFFSVLLQLISFNVGYRKVCPLGNICFFQINNNKVETKYMIPCIAISPNAKI